jgi:hypothetical protein
VFGRGWPGTRGGTRIAEGMPGKRPKSTRKREAAASDAAEIRQLEVLAQELKDKLARRSGPARWNASPDEVRRSVMQLVLTLVDFIRQVLERQALRRMDEGSLTPDEVERVGAALMQLEETVRDLARDAGLDPEDLNLDLGPLGTIK